MAENKWLAGFETQTIGAYIIPFTTIGSGGAEKGCFQDMEGGQQRSKTLIFPWVSLIG